MASGLLDAVCIGLAITDVIELNIDHRDVCHSMRMISNLNIHAGIGVKNLTLLDLF